MEIGKKAKEEKEREGEWRRGLGSDPVKRFSRHGQPVIQLERRLCKTKERKQKAWVRPGKSYAVSRKSLCETNPKITEVAREGAQRQGKEYAGGGAKKKKAEGGKASKEGSEVPQAEVL